MTGIEKLHELFELAAKYKEEYYARRPMMTLLNLIGFERGVESRATRYAMKRAKEELDVKSALAAAWIKLTKT